MSTHVIIHGTHDCDRQLCARLRPRGDDDVDGEAFKSDFVSVWESRAAHQIKLSVLIRREDHLVNPVENHIDGLLDQSRHDGERNGLLRTRRSICRHSLRAVICVHCNGEVEA